MGGRQNQAYTSYEEKWWAQEIPNSPPSRQKRPRQRGQTLPDQLKGRPAQSRVQRRKAPALSRFLMYMTLAVLAACLFMQVNRYAQIAQRTKKISALVGQIQALESDKANLELRLSARENLKRVRDEAMYNLGMDYPQEGQVRVVSIGTAAAQPQTAANSAELAP